MLVLAANEIRERAPMPRVIECLRRAFRSDFVAPERQVVHLSGGAGERLLLSMPAFLPSGRGAVKLATVFPDNPARGLPAIQAAIVVFAESGAPCAILDGAAVTHLRTGAASGLASSYLSRENSCHIVIVGTGALAPAMAEAHCTVRPIKRITVWGRRRTRVEATVEAIRSRVRSGIEVRATETLETVVRAADIVSCATSSVSPLIAGEWLAPGTFIDLVGSFSPAKREADDDVVRRSRIFVDTFAGAMSEAGDLLDPISRGVIGRERVEAELADLVCGRASGRTSAEEITLFKSVGTAIEDLALAQLIVGERAPAQ